MPEAELSIPKISSLKEVSYEFGPADSIAILSSTSYRGFRSRQLQSTFTHCFCVDRLAVDDLVQMAGINHVKRLALVGLNIGEYSAEVIAERFPQLTALNLSYNNIGPDGAATIARNPNLSELELRYNNIGDQGTQAIANNLSSLTSLHLEYNDIGYEGAAAIANNLHKLTSLDLGRNEIESAGVVELAEQLTGLVNSTSPKPTTDITALQRLPATLTTSKSSTSTTTTSGTKGQTLSLKGYLNSKL